MLESTVLLTEFIKMQSGVVGKEDNANAFPACSTATKISVAGLRPGIAAWSSCNMYNEQPTHTLGASLKKADGSSRWRHLCRQGKRRLRRHRVCSRRFGGDGLSPVAAKATQAIQVSSRQSRPGHQSHPSHPSCPGCDGSSACQIGGLRLASSCSFSCMSPV